MTMTKTIESVKSTSSATTVRTSHPGREHAAVEELKTAGDSADQGSVLAESERELLSEVLRAVSTINYGSIVLTIHEGRLVEISKTIRLRKHAPSRKE